MRELRNRSGLKEPLRELRSADDNNNIVVGVPRSVNYNETRLRDSKDLRVSSLFQDRELAADVPRSCTELHPTFDVASCPSTRRQPDRRLSGGGDEAESVRLKHRHVLSSSVHPTA